MALGKSERGLATWFGVGLAIWTSGTLLNEPMTFWVFILISVVAGARYGAAKGKAFNAA